MRQAMRVRFAGAFWLVLSMALKLAIAGDQTFSGECAVSSELENMPGKKVESKHFDCEGQCPVVDYGQEIFDACCQACQDYRQQGENFFGLCEGCLETDTQEDIAAALHKQGDGQEGGGRRRLQDTETETEDSATYTAECKAGKGSDGAVPPVTLKVWPCDACKSVPINWRKCCADCKDKVENTEPPVFWECSGCDYFSDRSSAIVTFLDDIIQDEVSKTVETTESEASTLNTVIAKMSLLLLGCYIN